MSFGWDGSDPTMENEPGVDYELATRYSANGDIAIMGVRVWAGSSSESVVGRKGRIWTTGGSLLAEVAIDASLAPGWTVYDLVEPVPIANGGTFDVSYSTLRFYGAVAGGYPNPSADGLVTATQGRFHNDPGTFPNTVSPGASFYGIDVEYVAAGNLAPEITALAVVPDGLDVDATVTISDETPASVTVRWLWGDGDESTTGAGVLTAAHTYDEPGLYAVGAIATDNAAQKGFRAAAVVVRDDGELLDLAAIVHELAVRIATVDGIRKVYEFGPDEKSIKVTPAAIVALPTDPISYLETYNQGGPAATAKIPIVVAVSKVHSRSAHALLAGFLSAAGPASVRAAIESGVYVHSSSPTCSTGVPDELPIAGDVFLSAVFDVDIMV